MDQNKNGLSNLMTDESLIADFKKIFRNPAEDPMRVILEQTWYRNILYYLGEQWLSWIDTANKFGRRYEVNRNIPTPVSNIVRDYVRSMKALTLNRRYTARVWPNSNELTDRDAALLGEKVSEDLEGNDFCNMERIKEMVETWRQLTGNGFTRVYAENDDGIYIVGENGNVVSPSKGEVGTHCIIPFNVYVPLSGVTLEEKRWIGIKSLKSREWVEDTFNVKLAENSDDNKNEIEFEKLLLRLIAEVSPWKGGSPDTSTLDTDTEDLVVFQEVEWRPTKTYPRGRYAAVSCGLVVQKKNDDMLIPTDKKTGKWSYSLTHFQYNLTPGGFWATAGVDDLISPQNTINEVDQTLAVNRKSLARPFVMSPTDLILKRKTQQGQGVLVIEYDGRGAGGAKPEVHPGTPYPNQILDERAINKQVAQDAAGDPKNILRGEAPSSAASGVLYDSLREAAEMSHSPDVSRFYNAWQMTKKKQLVVAQALYTETRFLKIGGSGRNVYVKSFKGADLRGNTDVRLELDKASAVSRSGQNETITKLSSGGFFGDMSVKPNMQHALLEKIGVSGLPDENTIHRNKAMWENSVLAYGGKDDVSKIAFPNPADLGEGAPLIIGLDGKKVSLFPKSYDPTFRMDRHDVHISSHDEFIFSDEFRALSMARQQWTIAHRDMHQAAIEAAKEKAFQQLARQAEMGIKETGGGPVIQPEAGMAGGQPEGQPPTESMNMQGGGGTV